MSDADLDLAIQQGDVVSFVSNCGKEMNAPLNIQLSSSAKKSNQEVLRGPEVELDEDAGRIFAKMFEKLEPDVAMGSGDKIPSTSEASQGAQTKLLLGLSTAEQLYQQLCL